MYSASLKLSKWADLENRKVPRRLFINQESISVLENSYNAELSITVACIAPTQRSFWIVFESENGDFIIQVSFRSLQCFCSLSDLLSLIFRNQFDYRSILHQKKR